ncbi:fibrillin-2 [Arapaima gigas]
MRTRGLLGCVLACAALAGVLTDSPARADDATRERRRGRQDALRGPNVCGSRLRSYCCPGWKTLPGGNQCVVRK